jgi:hypothetical protein
MSCSHFPFISLYYTYVILPSLTLFTSPHLHFTSFITFLIIFLKLLGLQERVPKVGSRSVYPIYKGVFSDICPLLSAPNFLVMIAPAQKAWPLYSVTYSLPSAFSRVCFEESAYASYLPALCQGSPVVVFIFWLKQIIQVFFLFSIILVYDVSL